MSDDKKPVDLADARTLADGLDVFDMPGTAEMMRDMADEIEAFRKAVKCALGHVEEDDPHYVYEAVKAMGRTLPPS